MSKVKCPICNRNFKEINLSHLRTHSLTVKEYDKLYPNFPRMSTEQRKTKARYANLTAEMSAKLKKSHTLEGYKEKYGSELGIKKFNERKINLKFSKTKDNYIRLYGESEGILRYNKYRRNAKLNTTIDNFIKKYGKLEGTIRYEKFQHMNKISNTLEHYKAKYGKDEGIKRWEAKNLKNSLSSMKIPPNEQGNYKLYKTIVMRLTRKTLRDCNIPNIHLIKKGEYSLDHKYSQLEGFKNNIPPYIISSQENLEVIEHIKNCSKHDSCSLTLIELLDKLELL